MKANKLMTSAVCASMILSIGGCAFFDKDDAGVLDAAEDYATAVTKVKTGDIAEMISGGDDLEDTIEAYTSGSEVETPEGYSDVVSAIAETISYEINEESVESSMRTAGILMHSSMPSVLTVRLRWRFPRLLTSYMRTVPGR